MIAAWLLYGCAIGALLTAGAFAIERLAQLRRWPTRWAWMGAIVTTFAVPLFLNLFPTTKVPAAAPATTAVSTPGTTIAQGLDAALVRSLDRPLVILWFGASLLLGTRMLVGLAALDRRRRDWPSIEVDGQRMLVTNALGPATLGWARPVLVMPRWALALDDASRRLIIAHEREHARNRDGVLGVIANVALVLMPWNPALWWARHRLRLAIEIDCDERVLASGVDRRQYASLLLTVGARASATPFTWSTAFAGRRSHLEHRIVAMTTPFRPRHPRLIGAALAAVALAAIIVACESPAPEPISPKTPAGETARATPRADRQVSTWTSETGDTIILNTYCTTPSGRGGLCIEGDWVREADGFSERERVECAAGGECRLVAAAQWSPTRVIDQFDAGADSVEITFRGNGRSGHGTVSPARPLLVVGTDTVVSERVDADGIKHKRMEIWRTGFELPKPNWVHWSPDGRTVSFERAK